MQGQEQKVSKDIPVPQTWCHEQEALKLKLVLCNRNKLDAEKIRFVGGVDISFVKDSSVAWAVLVVLDREAQNSVVHIEKYCEKNVKEPYIPGYLAFREAPLLCKLFANLEKKRFLDRNIPFPEVILVDGNGILHPKEFGLASHLGVLLNVPSIGVAKNLHNVDGLNKAYVTTLEKWEFQAGFKVAYLQSRTKGILGAAIYKDKTTNPVFVSIGHLIDLKTAIEITIDQCRYRIPEPVRQADIVGRIECRKMQT